MNVFRPMCQVCHTFIENQISVRQMCEVPFLILRKHFREMSVSPLRSLQITLFKIVPYILSPMITQPRREIV